MSKSRCKNNKPISVLLTTTALLMFFNMYSSHIDLRITSRQKQFVKKPIFRELFILLASYSISENIFISMIITLVYKILFDHILNEETKIGKYLNII